MASTQSAATIIVIWQCYDHAPHMRKQLHADRIKDDRQTLRESLISHLVNSSHPACNTYVWFSPLGLRNHDPMEKRMMKTSPMTRLQLRARVSFLSLTLQHVNRLPKPTRSPSCW